ncbi:glycosyltransferase family 2 protein [Pelagibius marinus]|uniref:glycosyltransferase family 2 protein n=1 Tax=Pelagibius marinus TaxID=2762760 RepID=UPI00187220BA|nr:glycosyltransferase family 2 protein [Pelagibius marinus]
MPLVSVVIPAFKAKAYLAGTVASAQSQSLRDIEIIIIDDASGDGTLELAQGLAAADSRVTVIAASRNGGPAAARNLGLAAARGDWIALLDADDAFEPGRLARLVGAARDHGADLLADNLLLDDARGAPQPMLPPGEGADCAMLSAAQFLRGNLPDPARPRKSYGFLKPLIRRAFLEERGLCYDEELRFAEDFAFYLDCLSAGARFYLLQEPLYRYRLRDDSLTARHSTEDLRRLQQVDQRLLENSEGASPTFRAALKAHKQSIDQRLQWRVVIDAVKRGAWLGALGASLRGWHVFSYVSGQLAGEAWRRLGSGRAKTAET